MPIDNPAPEPKQPFSRQNYIGTLGGPIRQDKLWFFSSFEYVREDASIAYSPGSIDAISIAAPNSRRRAYSRGSRDRVPNQRSSSVRRLSGYHALRLGAIAALAMVSPRRPRTTTPRDNDLVQQATLPSTGATSRANYLNLRSQSAFHFQPHLAWIVSRSRPVACITPKHATPILASRWPFPSVPRASTISGFETFGDNQFVTPITAFPVLRNQEKYQFRYDVSHTMGHHAPRFGMNFIHEPVLSGALSGSAETLIQFPNNPSFYVANPSQFYSDLTCATPQPLGVSCTATPAVQRQLRPKCATPGPLRRRIPGASPGA